MNGSDPVPTVLRVVIDELLSDPRTTEIVELARNANVLLSAFRERHVQSEPSTSGAFEDGAHAQPKPTPRQRLLFGEREPLSPTLIRKRRAALAALCHPDSGGDTDVMAELNAAVDVLLAECAQPTSDEREDR